MALEATSRRLKPLLLLLVAPLTMAPKCGEQVVIPSSDSSPPTADYRFRIEQGELQSVPARSYPDAADIEILEGQTVCVYTGASDPQGLKYLQQGGDLSWVCKDPNSTRTRHHLAALYDDEAQAGKPGDKAYTGMYLEHCQQLTDLCGDWTLRDGAQLRLWPKAQNFHGTKTALPALVVDIKQRRASSPSPSPNPPSPSPPRTCSSTEQCCEPNPDGGCQRCIPRSQVCQ